MNPNTGEIYMLSDEDFRSLERNHGFIPEREGQKLIPLTDRQHEELKPLGAAQRKGFMRNQPCICGSGKKFKKCCWNKYAANKGV